MFTIHSVSPSVFDGFMAYLNDHLAENGTPEAGYFQPLSRGTCTFPADRVTAFRAGLQVPPGQPGWRRAWVARSGDGQIVGHVDLRGHSERHAEHRCLLGMGVHRDWRRQGMGTALIQHAQRWAGSTTLLEHIDLQVLSSNQAALALYRRSGFRPTGEVADMFKLDGQYFALTAMTMPVQGP